MTSFSYIIEGDAGYKHIAFNITSGDLSTSASFFDIYHIEKQSWIELIDAMRYGSKYCLAFYQGNGHGHIAVKNGILSFFSNAVW
jgi:hypothetical protein